MIRIRAPELHQLCAPCPCRYRHFLAIMLAVSSPGVPGVWNQKYMNPPFPRLARIYFPPSQLATHRFPYPNSTSKIMQISQVAIVLTMVASALADGVRSPSPTLLRVYY